MPRPSKDTVQLTFRVPRTWLSRADTIAKQLSLPGMPATRTDAFRRAIARGFDSLTTDLKENRDA